MNTTFVSELPPLPSEVPPQDLHQYDQDIELVYSVFIILIISYIPCIIVSNVLIFWSTILNPTFHTSYNYLLCSLAVADFSMGIVTIPMYILANWSKTKDLIIYNKYACLFWFSSIMTSGGGSLYHLLGIALDRYMAIVYPLLYKSVVTLHFVKRFLAGLWCFILFIAAIPLMGFNYYDSDRLKGTPRCDFYETLPKIYVWWAALGSVFICTFIPLLLYVQIMHVIFREKRDSMAPSGARSRYKKRAASVKITAALMLIFIALWSPYLILPPLKYVVKFSKKDTEIIRVIVHLLNFANSMVNAPIYAKGRPEYRATYRLMLTNWPWNWRSVLLEHRRHKYAQRMLSIYVLKSRRDSPDLATARESSFSKAVRASVEHSEKISMAKRLSDEPQVYVSSHEPDITSTMTE